MKTADDIKKEITPEIRKEMIDSLNNDKEFKYIKSIPGMVELWCAGWWLEDELEKSGKDKDEIEDIAFEHGRISFMRDPYEMAARQYNKYILRENLEKLSGNIFQHNV